MVEPYVGYSELARYLKENDNVTWSYADFLSLHRDTLLKSPPYLNEWFHLDGRWANRFLYKVRELDPSNFSIMEKKVKSERANNRFQLYWEEIIYERKTILANQTHLNASMDLLGIAGKQNFRQMTSRGYLKTFGETNELQKMSYTEPQETIFLDFENNPFLDKDEKHKSSNYSISSESGFDDASGGSSSRTLVNTISQKSDDKEMCVSEDDEDSETSDLDTSNHGEMVDEEEEEVETTDDKKVKENKNGTFRLSEEHRQIVEQTFNSMKKERMWRLSTGKYVEEELFELGKKLEFEHAVHSFIVDVDDVIIRQHFDKTELDEMDDSPDPQVPELSDEIVEFLNKFSHKTKLNDIRRIIKEMIFDDNYDHEKDHDKDYIIYALYSLVREIQSESLKDVNLEAWFNCHVWNAIFDQAFGDLKALSVVRGESSSLASASRKNSKRQSGERRKMGRRGDWILRRVSNGVKDEFGAGEAGKSWTDKNGTKVLKEKLKLLKTLKDMLIKLMDKVDWDVEMCSKIQTVGMIHAGMIIMTIYMDNPKGYICRVRHGEPMEVPDEEENFSSILEILASVLNMKAAVRETMKVVQVKKQKKQTKSFKTAGLRKRPRDENQNRLFSCLPTPKKAKVCVKAKHVHRRHVLDHYNPHYR